MGCNNCGKKKAQEKVIKMDYTSRDMAFHIMRDNIEGGKYKGNESIATYKKDLLAAFGVTDHPKAEKAFAMAWDQGHAYGLYEVLLKFADLVELIV